MQSDNAAEPHQVRAKQLAEAEEQQARLAYFGHLTEEACPLSPTPPPGLHPRLVLPRLPLVEDYEATTIVWSTRGFVSGARVRAGVCG